MDLKAGAGLTLNRSLVPEKLHTLIPLVERWGFSSQAEQDAFFLQIRESPAEIEKFNFQIDTHRDEILEWGRALPEINRPKSEISEDGWNHPYWAFLHALKMRELTEPEDSPTAIASREQFKNDARIYRFRESISRAEQMFREKDYAGFVALIEPFRDLLSDSQNKKLEIAEGKLK